MTSRPYLKESVAGARIEFTSVLALLGFVAVIGVWLSTFFPTLKGALSMFSIGGMTINGQITPTPTYVSPSFISQPTPYIIVPTVQVVVVQPTPLPTAIPLPTPTPGPTQIVSEGYIPFVVYPEPGTADLKDLPGVPIKVKVSFYYPPLGGINCDQINGIQDCLHLANGEEYYKWVGRGMACPAEWPFGSQIELMGQVWECVDRGGAIVEDGGAYWVDLLYPFMPLNVYWGAVLDATLYLNQ
jgi:hypothetical protein